MNLWVAVLVDLMLSPRKATDREEDPTGFPPGPMVRRADSEKVSNTTEERYRWKTLFFGPKQLF